ncbi:MAG: S9 family peptidase, partial [Actinomycetota bacterium]
MSSKTTSPYGSWPSPITAAAVARRQSYRYSDPRPAKEGSYWLEARPHEGGRLVVTRGGRDRSPEALTPRGYNARTRVHEYGGGSYIVDGSTVFFANFEDQRLYRQDDGSEPRAITPSPDVPAGDRYADMCPLAGGRLIVCVRERHAVGREHVNELVVVPTDGGWEPRVIASGHDFYSTPRPSPDGGRLCWLSWDHPNMPWDGSDLWVADLIEGGSVANERHVAGAPYESIFQPAWSPSGILHLVSDRSGWWNLYRLDDGEAHPLAPMEAEFAVPQWVFSFSTYGFLPDGRIVCTYFHGGRDHIGIIDTGGDLRTVENAYTSVAYLKTEGVRALFVGATPTDHAQVVELYPEEAAFEVLTAVEGPTIDHDYVSEPEAIEFPTGGEQTAHALYYPPVNPASEGPVDEKPPLLVQAHGGPTAHVVPELSEEIQFWTSRGIAVVDVNYGGSTGYGRDYRRRLNGQWGIVDVVDTVNAARHLVRRRDADPERLIIHGGSAGGWVTLCALTFHDDFAAGGNYFGVSDLMGFVDDTHKFESRYLFSLVGPFPEEEKLWRERSPINFVDRISAPVITLQGLEDEVVPPAQSEVIVEALRAKGLPCAYLTFEGEQHGFRRSESIERALEAELYFYARVLGFEPADDIHP